jgi:SAM-dependent methyltransferase
MLDEIAAYNKERWEALAEAGVPYSLPFLHLTPETARDEVDPHGLLGPSFEGRDVLCLAAGGGQQSAAFGILGARVTVLDLCETQLARDREAAEHYGLTPRLVQGDMRDLSCFADASFDVVWHAHSINFVPDPRRVFAEVARVLRPGGMYRLSCWNPFAHGGCEVEWNGRGYVISQPYGEGLVDWTDEPWDIASPDGVQRQVQGPHEFRHALSTYVNGTAEVGLRIIRLEEEADVPKPGEPPPEPGSWQHFGTVLPHWLGFWMRLEA